MGSVHVVCEVERAPVDGEHEVPAHHLVGVDGLLRPEMYVRPEFIVGASLDHGRVEGPRRSPISLKPGNIAVSPL